MSNTPQRIQRKRTKGWTMPQNTIYVGRGSKLGNPFRVVRYSDGKWSVKCDDDERQAAILTSTCRAVYDTKQEAQADAVKCYQKNFFNCFENQKNNQFLDHYLVTECNINEVKFSLAGKNIACWCAPGDPCHADFLLEIANK